MNLIYNNELISTQDEIKISVADLRDLIQAGELVCSDERQAINEYNLIINSIIRKNRLLEKTLSVE